MVTTKQCSKCDGECAGWVCESHPNKSWPDICQCGPGMPCLDCYGKEELPQ